MDNSHLKYLINEEIYLINESQATYSPSEAQKSEKKDIALPHVEGASNSSTYIINFETSHELIAPEQRNFLENILTAVNLSLNQIALVNLAKSEQDISAIIQHFTPTKCIVFGMPDNNKALYTLTDIKGCQVLFADSLQTISSDKSKKKALWTNLQHLFLK